MSEIKLKEGIFFVCEGLSKSRLVKLEEFLRSYGLHGKAFFSENLPTKEFIDKENIQLVIFGDIKSEIRCFRAKNIETLKKEGSEKFKTRIEELVNKLNTITQNNYIKPIKLEKPLSFEIDGPIDGETLTKAISIFSKFNVIIFSKLLNKRIFIGQESNFQRSPDIENMTPEEFCKMALLLNHTKAELIRIETIEQDSGTKK